MKNGIVFGYLNGAVIDPPAQPICLVEGLSLASTAAVVTAMNAFLDDRLVTDGGAGGANGSPVRVLAVTLEDDVVVGDILDVETAAYKKHV